MIPFHPTPWSVDAGGVVFAANGTFVAAFADLIDAEFAVRAANRYPQTLDAIAALIEHSTAIDGDLMTIPERDAWRRACNIIADVAAKEGLDRA